LPDTYFKFFSKSSNKNFTKINSTEISSPLNVNALNKTIANNKLINSWKEKIVKSANLICEHNFSFLGMNNKFFGKKINWNQDIRTGHKWVKKYYTSFTANELMPGNGIDIKIPWELNRFHHLVVLAQAWHLSKNKKFSDEIFSQLDSWIESNPYGYGINWVNTMEVSIRAVNIIVSLDLISDAPGYNKYQNKFFNSIVKHGYFIEKNLEIGISNGKIVAANHFLANISGLAIIGMSLCGISESKRWSKAGIKALERAINTMTLKDGFFFESSTSYHRLAIELFYYPMIQAAKSGHRFSKNYLNKLEKMMEVIMYLNNPGNLVPQIGDNDNGRLLILSNYPYWETNDYRYLLGMGGLFFKRGDFKNVCGNYPQEVFWISGYASIKDYKKITNDKSEINSKGFENAGLYVIRNDNKKDYALIKTGGIKQFLPTAHMHNDYLSLELWIKGKPIIVDPGTFCYTSSIKDRNYFRSTASHNTIMINNKEMNLLSKHNPFVLIKKTKSKIIDWKVEKEKILFTAENDWSKRLNFNFKHQRKIIYNLIESIWEIQDSFLYPKDNLVNIKSVLNFYESNEIGKKADNKIELNNSFFKMRLKSDTKFFAEKLNSFYSKSYGEKVSSKILTINSNNCGAIYYRISSKN
tara:strand:- start:5258 stop:7174 length:1917 start_codon:yes stop_codon:yes gene_type:complete